MNTLRPNMHAVDQDVMHAQRLLQLASYEEARITGFYDQQTTDLIELFQAQHVGPRGRQLEADGIVGPATWWALSNHSGILQRSHNRDAPQYVDLTTPRYKLLKILQREYLKGIREIPDGSNRSEHIDEYWGNTGLIGLAWCCAYVSTMARRANIPHFSGVHHVSVYRMWQAAEHAGLISDYPRPGHIFVQLFSSGRGHTGFVTAMSERAIATNEGNCGNRLKNGRRLRSTITGYIDLFQDNQSARFTNIGGEELLLAGATGTR